MSGPADAVRLPARTARELAAAVAAALDNVARHCDPGTKVYLFVEDEPAEVIVTACPLCKKAIGRGTKSEVRDLAEIVVAAIK